MKLSNLDMSFRAMSGIYCCNCFSWVASTAALSISIEPNFQYFFIRRCRPLYICKHGERRGGKEKARGREQWCHFTPAKTTSSFSLKLNGFLEVMHLEVGKAISLTRKCKDGIGSKPDCSVHPRCEVKSQKWKTWIRNLCTGGRQ